MLKKKKKKLFKQLGLLHCLHPFVLSELLILIMRIYARAEAVSDRNSSLSCSFAFSPSLSFAKIPISDRIKIQNVKIVTVLINRRR